MKIDLHTHTTRHSGCARGEPHKMAEAAIEAGLDGIVFTEHDALWDDQELNALKQEYKSLVILNGIEVNIAEDEHILVYGVLDPSLFYPKMPLEELDAIVRKHNGLMVIAHPFRYKDNVAKEVLSCNVEGVEVMSNNILSYTKIGIDSLLLRKKFIKVAGSDAHGEAFVGLFATVFNSKISNERDLVKAIREDKHKLYVNRPIIEDKNNSIRQAIAYGKELLAQGLPDDEVRKLAKLSQKMLEAAKNDEELFFYI